jgi:hypothetical protein
MEPNRSNLCWAPGSSAQSVVAHTRNNPGPWLADPVSEPNGSAISPRPVASGHSGLGHWLPDGGGPQGNQRAFAGQTPVGGVGAVVAPPQQALGVPTA